MTTCEPGPAFPGGDLFGSVEAAVADNDPVSFMRALANAGAALPLHPFAAANAVARLATGSMDLWASTVRCALGERAPGSTADNRFKDTAYERNPYFFALRQSHQLAEKFVLDLVGAAGLSEHETRKAEFASRLMMDAMSPSNTLLGNPEALRTAFDTGGMSLVQGMRNWMSDLQHNGGWPSQVDSSGFEVGRNMAATKGKVVYRNRLIELIQYEPQTDEVYEVPLLFCPPWINKFYIMDLAPGRSLIEWALQHGHRCFAISYRNPDETMRDVGMDDYLFEGPLTAIKVVRQVSDAAKVNLLAACLGGTLNAIALARMARKKKDVVNTATFLNSHTDFTLPGELGIFIDDKTVSALERKMDRRGYLEATEMAKTFDALRAKDLIFSFAVNNWLLGKSPGAFDLLAWNSDSTRMPAKMHSEYLRTCYLRNEFARGEFRVRGKRVDPKATTVEKYVLSAIGDHIVPWQSAYKTTHVLGGPSRFVLSTSGHIAGIVNPPSPKAKFWTNEDLPVESELWLKAADLHQGTWWDDWATWMSTRAGDTMPASHELGSEKHPAGEDAPGSYVKH